MHDVVFYDTLMTACRHLDTDTDTHTHTHTHTHKRVKMRRVHFEGSLGNITIMKLYFREYRCIRCT